MSAERLRAAPRILVDGRSGSGKTEFCRAIVDLWPEAQLVRLDDLYPGWDGLAAGSRQVYEQILPHHRWQRYDWRRAALAEWHELDPALPLIVEGCGALSRASRALADEAIWVEHPEADRKRRALARDPGFAAYWEQWAEQEDAFIARENPRELADWIVDGGDVVREAVFWRALQR